LSDADFLREFDQIDGVKLPEQTLQIVGHEDVFATLKNQLKNNMLPNAILLHGQKGIGKASFAFMFAKLILSKSGNEDINLVNEQIINGAHPNLYILRKTKKDNKSFYSDIRIDEIREFKKTMQKTRGKSAKRICIIDAIDDCNIKSSNALLKILEEPPKDTLFMLISHRPGSLLPTIHSRCISYAFRALNDSHVKQIIAPYIEENEGQKIDIAIKLAKGRARRAIEVLKLNELGLLNELQDWLNLDQKSDFSHLSLAEKITKAKNNEQEFAKDIIIDFIAEEAKKPNDSRVKLASTLKLWEKTKIMFDEAVEYNLDKKQTLIHIFDEIIKIKQI